MVISGVLCNEKRELSETEMRDDVPDKDKVVNNIVQHFPDVEKLVWFGSQFRGNAGPDSEWTFWWYCRRP